MNWIYGVRITEQAGDFVVSVRDLPEVVTSGSSHEEALDLAADGIAVIIGMFMDRERDLPVPSPLVRGEHAVPLAAPLAAKASVYHLWRTTKISKSELARRMGRTETEARRILSPRSGTKLDQLSEAAKALGGRIVVGIAV